MTAIRRGLLLTGAAWLAIAALAPLPSAAAAPDCGPTSSDNFVCESLYGDSPPDGSGNVGTAVHVVMHGSFAEAPDPDQCVGTSALAAIHRDATVILSEGSAYTSGTRQVAVGQFFRSRMKDGNCEVLYVISAPAMPAFNVAFADRAGARSPTFGPVGSESITDQPGILQAVRVDLGLG